MICRGNSPIPIPISEMALETPTWLNLCFVEKILRKSEGDNSIRVTDIFSKAATNKGDNYTSDMIRVIAEYTRNQADSNNTEKKAIIIKVAPEDEGMKKELVSLFRLHRVLWHSPENSKPARLQILLNSTNRIIANDDSSQVLRSGIFDTEILMMTDTLEKMNKLLGDYPLNGKSLFVQKENPILLVIEDLAPLGFRMACRRSGLDINHSILAIRGLARFHAASVALCEKVN